MARWHEALRSTFCENGGLLYHPQLYSVALTRLNLWLSLSNCLLFPPAGYLNSPRPLDLSLFLPFTAPHHHISQHHSEYPHLHNSLIVDLNHSINCNPAALCVLEYAVRRDDRC